MNPTKEGIKERLSTLPGEWEALSNIGLKYLNYCCAVDMNETLLLGHRPWVAPENYAIRIFSPAKKSWTGKLKKIPKPYRDLLLSFNGLFAFDLSLYGLAPTLQESPPRLDRSVVQCHDLSIANQNWILDYSVSPDAFHFGGRAYNEEENVGYFMFGEGVIQAIRYNGKQVGEWNTLTELLAEELPVAEQIAMKEIPVDWWE